MRNESVVLTMRGTIRSRGRRVVSCIPTTTLLAEETLAHSETLEAVHVAEAVQYRRRGSD